MNDPVAVAVLAKAPLPGFAKTRLIPALGEEGAALLQARLVEHAVETVCAACLGPVTLWAAPDESHPLFQGISARFGVALACQDAGDLGARMLTAMAAANAPALIVGTDCPALTSDHLRAAADILRDGADAAMIPADDGGYVLIGMRRPVRARCRSAHRLTGVTSSCRHSSAVATSSASRSQNAWAMRAGSRERHCASTSRNSTRSASARICE